MNIYRVTYDGECSVLVEAPNMEAAVETWRRWAYGATVDAHFAAEDAESFEPDDVQSIDDELIRSADWIKP